MKRRNFLKGLLGVGAGIAAPSLVVSGIKESQDRVIIRKGLPDAYFKTMKDMEFKDNTSVWGIKWGKDEVTKIQVFENLNPSYRFGEMAIEKSSDDIFFGLRRK